MANRGENLMKKFQSVVLVSLTAMFCLFSTAFAAAQTIISVTAVNFGVVVENTTSATKTVTHKNTGMSSITISQPTVTAGTPYSILPASTCPNSTLAAGKSCTVLLTFSPLTTGSQPATLTITTTALINGTRTASLSGTGIAPTWLSSPSISFAAVDGEVSAPKTVVLYNYQLTPLGITSITVPTPYAVSGTCPITGGTLPASSSCTISVTVTPPSVGALPAGSLTINTDAPNTPNTASLSGTAVAPTWLSSTSIYFAAVDGEDSAPKTVVL